MSDKQVRVGIAAFVLRDGKFLMQQRKGSHGEGTWSTPGGHLDFGESFEDTARREVKEETGMDITNVRFGAITNDLFVNEGKHYVTIWMISDWARGEPYITEPDKCVAQGWFDFDSLPEPLFFPWIQLKKSEYLDLIRTQLLESK